MQRSRSNSVSASAANRMANHVIMSSKGDASSSRRARPPPTIENTLVAHNTYPRSLQGSNRESTLVILRIYRDEQLTSHDDLRSLKITIIAIRLTKGVKALNRARRPYSSSRLITSSTHPSASLMALIYRPLWHLKSPIPLPTQNPQRPLLLHRRPPRLREKGKAGYSRRWPYPSLGALHPRLTLIPPPNLRPLANSKRRRVSISLLPHLSSPRLTPALTATCHSSPLQRLR